MQAFGRIKRIVTASADAIILYFDGANLDDANNACHHMLAAIDSKKEAIRGLGCVSVCLLMTAC